MYGMAQPGGEFPHLALSFRAVNVLIDNVLRETDASNLSMSECQNEATVAII